MRHALMTALILACVLAATLPLWAEEPEAPVPAPAPTPAPQVDDAEIQRLVDDLGSSDFAKRERASRELLALGEKARPALEETMSKSDNMEARWRAEQILRRMDREGERRMGDGAGPPQPRQGPSVLPPGSPPLPPSGIPPSGLDEMQRRMNEMRRRLLDGFGPRAFGSFGPSRTTLEAPGLRLDAEVFAGRLVQVTVLDHEAPRAYRGRSLEEILERNPELGQRAGMAELREKWEAFKAANPGLFGDGFGMLQPSSGFSFSQSSQGVQVIHDPEGVTVRVSERDENGEEKVTVVKGASLDEIREKYPELREKLDGFGGLRVQLGPVQIFRNRPGERRLPVPPAPPKTEVTPGDDDRMPGIFGVRILAPEPVLAVHLGLEPGHGALVTQVIPATQAAAMGLERYDVIVAVNGAPVTDHREATLALRKAARDRTALSLDLIRRGSRITLER